MKYGKIAELEALIDMNEMIIEDYSDNPEDMFYQGKIAENEMLKKRLRKLNDYQ